MDHATEILIAQSVFGALVLAIVQLKALDLVAKMPPDPSLPRPGDNDASVRRRWVYWNYRLMGSELLFAMMIGIAVGGHAAHQLSQSPAGLLVALPMVYAIWGLFSWHHASRTDDLRIWNGEILKHFFVAVFLGAFASLTVVLAFGGGLPLLIGAFAASAALGFAFLAGM